MRAAVEDDLGHPGPLAREYATQKGQRFLGDIGAWAAKPGLRRYVETSPAAEIAARMLKSQKANFLYDQLFVKEPGTAARTPWHQDGPYWPVQGQQILSIWLALDDVTVESSGVEYLKGSHRWGKEYRPIHFGGDTKAYKMLPGETLPDIDALRKEPGNMLDVVNWDVKVGDCLLHHSMTVHGAPGNASSTQLHPAPPRPRDALDRRRCGVRTARRAGTHHDQRADLPRRRADRMRGVSPLVAEVTRPFNGACRGDPTFQRDPIPSLETFRCRV